MRHMKKLTVRSVQQFITERLSRKLQRDLQHCFMLKESDLECCSYFYLRKYLAQDNSWRIFARKHVKEDPNSRSRKYIDFILFEQNVPRLALELKWNAKSLGKKDRESLNACIGDLNVHKAY